MAEALQPPAEDCPPPTFRDIVSRPTVPIKEITTFKNGGSFKGEPALYYSTDEISTLAAPFNQALVGKFDGIRPNMEFIRKGFQLIRFKGDVSLGMLDSHHVLIRFGLHEDYYRCWMRGSWSFKKHIVKVLKWTPEFTADHEPPVAPVWISLHHLPLHFFQRGPLLSIASLIGRPLRIDGATRSLTRPSVARVCVEVNLLHTLPKRVWIAQGESGFWQAISYDHLPQYCTACYRLGHATGDCSAPPEQPKHQPLSQQIWRPKPTTHPNSSGLSNLDKQSVPIDVQQTIAQPNTLGSNLDEQPIPTDVQQTIAQSSSQPLILQASMALPNPTALPASVEVPDATTQQDLGDKTLTILPTGERALVAGIPDPQVLAHNSAPVIVDPDLSSDEEAAYIVTDATNPSLRRSGSEPDLIIEQHQDSPQQPLSLSQPDPTNEDEEWMVQKKRKPYQK